MFLYTVSAITLQIRICMMTTKNILTLAILSLILVGQIACAQPGLPKTEKAPNFKLKTQEGKTFELSKLKGKVVAVNFWATWCGPCRKEIPGFMEVYEQYKDKGLEIVGVSLDQEGWQVVKPYLERSKINYPIVVGNGDLVQAYGGFNGIPATFVIDKKGNIFKRHIGYMNKSAFESIVKDLL